MPTNVRYRRKRINNTSEDAFRKFCCVFQLLGLILLSFIKEDPGRQSISGSFNPIDVGEWSAQVYIGETEHFFAAVVAHDRERVSKMLTDDSIDINRRDHVGRTALHVAILSKATDIACDLIDAGARISARLVDGRNALHIAAQLDQPVVVRKLLERSAINEKQSKDSTTNDTEDIEEDKGIVERPSSEDDWSSEDGGVIALDTEDDDDSDADDEDEGEEGPPKQPVATTTPAASAAAEAEVFPEDQTETPDILDVNLLAWDYGFTPLAYAVVFASQEMVEVLLTAGADPHLLNTTRDSAFHLLTLLILREDEDEASKILERLILAGASTSTADDQMRSIFHRVVMADKLRLVSSILHCDPNAKAVLEFPAFVQYGGGVVLPIVSAIAAGKYAMIALLLAHGAKLVIAEEDVAKALSMAYVNYLSFIGDIILIWRSSPLSVRQCYTGYNSAPVLHRTFAPLEVAIARQDDLAQLLISLGAEVDTGISQALFHQYSSATDWRSIMDWVQWAIASISQEAEVKTVAPASSSSSWKQFHANILNPKKGVDHANKVPGDESKKTVDLLDYFRNIEGLLAARGAGSWNDIYPDKPSAAQITAAANQYAGNNHPWSYLLITPRGSTEGVPRHLNVAYDELYEACFTGDNKKVQQLCLPQDGSDANESLLNIFAQVVDPSNQYTQTGQRVQDIAIVVFVNSVRSFRFHAALCRYCWMPMGHS
jgi:ankyrin repeat protein